MQLKYKIIIGSIIEIPTFNSKKFLGYNYKIFMSLIHKIEKGHYEM